MVRIDLDSKPAGKSSWGFDLDAILRAQKTAFNADPNPSWASRKDKLKRLGNVIAAHGAEFQKAISEDFGNRAYEETTIAELMVIQGGISHALKHTQSWMRPRKVPTALQFMPAKNRVYAQPLGVIGIIK